MRPLRILHLITRMDRGGSAVNTLICATAQANAGHQVTLATGLSLESDMNVNEQAAVDQSLELYRQAGGHLLEIPDLRRSVGWSDVKAWWQTRDVLRQGFDVLHTHTSKAGAIGRMAASGNIKGKKVAIVHTPHGHVFHGYFGTLKTCLFRWVEYILAWKTDALVALTQAERNDHLQLGIGKEEQWHVIASGVDVDGISQRVHAIRGDEPRWLAVSVGRLVPIKGMDRLLRAWAEVNKTLPDARLAIVGDGSERQSLEALSRSLGLEDVVFFAGWDDPLPYLADAKSFVLLSHNEGMGRAVVEAFAAGLPCVVSNVCGLSELVDERVGMCVNADEAQDVATALLTDWQDTHRQSAKERAKEYSVEGMVHDLSKLYQQVCDD